ncbi:MAG: hypothetical protein WC979_06190 [Candidatus Pacearchaeota archaeon]|jgi:hypothetical protein
MEQFEKNTVKSFRKVKSDMESLKVQIENLNEEHKELMSLVIELKDFLSKKSKTKKR